MQKSFIARGPFCYGFGDTADQAKKNCRVNKPSKNYYKGKFKMEVFEYLSEFSKRVTISEMDGRIEYPNEAQFKQIE